jgi:hypothetical protein
MAEIETQMDEGDSKKKKEKYRLGTGRIGSWSQQTRLNQMHHV